MSSKTEWGFGVPAEQVDVERIYVELAGRVAIEVHVYLHQLRKHAPTVYRRLEVWAKKHGLMSYVNWR